MQLTPQEEQIYAVLSRILVEDFEVPAENAAMLLWNRMDPELNALLPLLRERYTKDPAKTLHPTSKTIVRRHRMWQTLC